MLNKKRIRDLTETDFLDSPSWLRLDLDSDIVIQNPERGFNNLEEDMLLLAGVSYVLNDGTRLTGFCSLYEVSGFYYFYRGKQRHLIDWEYDIDEAQAKRIAGQMGKAVADVFPAQYACPIRLFGQEVAGTLKVWETGEGGGAAM